jgi:hypothetical protein
MSVRKKSLQALESWEGRLFEMAQDGALILLTLDLETRPIVGINPSMTVANQSQGVQRARIQELIIPEENRTPRADRSSQSQNGTSPYGTGQALR